MKADFFFFYKNKEQKNYIYIYIYTCVCVFVLANDNNPDLNVKIINLNNIFLDFLWILFSYSVAHKCHSINESNT